MNEVRPEPIIQKDDNGYYFEFPWTDERKRRQRWPTVRDALERWARRFDAMNAAVVSDDELDALYKKLVELPSEQALLCQRCGHGQLESVNDRADTLPIWNHVADRGPDKLSEIKEGRGCLLLALQQGEAWHITVYRTDAYRILQEMRFDRNNAITTNTEFVALQELLRKPEYRAADEAEKLRIEVELVRTMRAEQEAREKQERERREETERLEAQERQNEAEERRRLWEDRLQQTKPRPYKTLKAAYADGWHKPKLNEYGGKAIRIKDHVLVRDTQKAVSQTEWGRRGYEVLPDQQPHAWRSSQFLFTYAVFRKDQVGRLKKTRRSPRLLQIA